MPTVKFNLREEVMKEALKIKEKLGLTWREATLQGLGFTVEPPKIGRPHKKPKIEKTEQEKNLEKQIMNVVIDTFLNIAIWRDFLPLRELADSSYKFYKYYTEETEEDVKLTDKENIPFYPYKEVKIPIISKTFKVYKNGILNLKGIIDTAEKIAIEEGKLILVGEHEGWNALGIEGFSTVKNRNIMTSNGFWPKNIFSDIIDVKNSFNPIKPIILVAPTYIINSLDQVMWKDPECAEPPITYKNFLVEQQIISKIYETDALFTKNGTQDTALILSPNKNNFYMVQAMRISPYIWKDKTDITWCTLREAVTVAIPNPKGITQITDIKVKSLN